MHFRKIGIRLGIYFRKIGIKSAIHFGKIAIRNEYVLKLRWPTPVQSPVKHPPPGTPQLVQMK